MRPSGWHSDIAFHIEGEFMNLYAPVLNLEEFGPENMLSALKAECEHVIHLPGKKFNLKALL